MEQDASLLIFTANSKEYIYTALVHVLETVEIRACLVLQLYAQRIGIRCLKTFKSLLHAARSRLHCHDASLAMCRFVTEGGGSFELNMGTRSVSSYFIKCASSLRDTFLVFIAFPNVSHKQGHATNT